MNLSISFWPAYWRGLGIALALLLAGCSGGSDPKPEVPPAPGWQRVAAVPAQMTEVLLSDGARLWVAGGARIDRYDADTDTWDRLPDLPVGEVAALERIDGRLFAGTYQQGVQELVVGATQWRDRSQGLSGAGAKTVVDFTVRGAELFAATQGSGVFRLSLDTAEPVWSPFRDGIPAALSYNVDSIETHRGRLVAGAGGNGNAYLQVEGEAGWREVRYAEFTGSQLSLLALLDTPTALIGGSTFAFYRSADGGESWVAFDPQIGLINPVRFVRDGERLFALATKPSGSRLYRSDDDGIGWVLVDALPGVQAFDIAIAGDALYLAHLEGLWRTPLARLRDA